MSITNPTIPPIVDPKGLDVLLAEIQTILETVSWLDTAYGQTEKHYDENRSYPAIYTGSDYLSMLPDGHLGNYSFFIVQDPQQVQVDFQQEEFAGTMRLVVFFNWDNVYADHKTYENIKYDILEVLRNPGLLNGRIEVKAFYKDVENIFKGYKVDPSLRPYGAVAFDINYITMNRC